MKKLYNNTMKHLVEIKQRINNLKKNKFFILLLGYSYLSTQITITLISSNPKINRIITPLFYILKKYPSLESFLLYPKKSFSFFQILVEFLNVIYLHITVNYNEKNKEKKTLKNELLKILFFSYRQFKRGMLLGIFIEAFKLGS